MNNGLVATNYPEKTLNLKLTNLRPLGSGAVFGLSNAVLRLINPNFKGYLTFSATNYSGLESFGEISFTVNRVAGSLGTLSIQYATRDGAGANGATNGVDYIGATNTLTWNNGDVSPKTVTLPLKNTAVVGVNKQFGVYLFNPQLNNVSTPSLLQGVISNATLTIINDNSYGTLQLSSTNYIVNENGGYITVTVNRTDGVAGPVSVNYVTSDGTATAGANYTATTGTISFEPGQVSASFNVPIVNDGMVDPANFYFNVALSSPVNVVLGAWINAQVHIVDVQTYNQPPGDMDTLFNSTTSMNAGVLALALQSNGKILAGGNFTMVGNVTRNHIARLNPDGSLDTTFLNGLSGVIGAVNAIVNQTDDRILIGGAFNSVNNVHFNFIARLMTDGTIDTSFNPGAGADGSIYALAETFIGGARKLYVGGTFGSLNSVSSPSLIRLNNNGTVDTSFITGVGFDGPIYAIAAYPTNSVYAGKVLVGGAFAHYNGTSLKDIVRLNADGSLDVGFNAGTATNSTVNTIVIQPDGRILVGGSFTSVNGMAVNRLVRLNGDGSTDTNFVANIGTGANNTVESISLQQDNRIVVAGQFTQVNGIMRNHITRLLQSGLTDPHN
ncbi:MAG: Calx-beta domain-containing protein [Limisphaerales bacterium]